jgi:orotate phosphoribosyltransferase
LLSSPHEHTKSKLVEIVRNTGALLHGHFELQSGRHSPYFLRFSQIGWDRPAMAEIADMLVQRAPFLDESAILTPESSSVFLGRAIATRTGCPLAVAAIDATRRPTGILRAGGIDASRRLTIVADVVTTGESLTPLLELGVQSPALAVVAFLVLSTSRFEALASSRRLEREWLLASTWETTPASDCPQCGKGAPLISAAELN